MPCACTILPERSLVLSRIWDVVRDPELLAHLHSLTVDKSFAPNFNQLVDMRDVTEVLVSAATMREIAKSNPYGAGARRALVASSDIVFGMARMYDQLREDSSDELQIFQNIDEAFQWLGISSEKDQLLQAISNISPIVRLD